MIQELKRTLVKKAVVKKVVKEPIKDSVKEVVRKIVVTQEMIEKKAYELYVKRGYQNGFAKEDWIEAKRLLEAGK